MKKFLLKIAFFFCLVGFAALLLQMGISAKIKNENLRGNDILQMSDANFDVVLMGSSRCWAQFDPAFYKKSYGLTAVNIGMSGHSEIPMAVMRLENYLSKNKAPKFAVFNFDPLVFIEKPDAERPVALKNDFSRYAFWPDQRDLPILDFFRFDRSEKYIPLYAIFKYKLFKDCVFPQKSNYYLEYGYERNDKHWDTIKYPFNDKMKKNYAKSDEVPAITNAMADLQQLCDKNNITLICIQTPVFKIIHDDATFSRQSKTCKNLAIPFVDTDIPAIRNDINCFYNSDHLNTFGVSKMNAFLEKNEVMNAVFGVYQKPKINLATPK